MSYTVTLDDSIVFDLTYNWRSMMGVNWTLTNGLESMSILVFTLNVQWMLWGRIEARGTAPDWAWEDIAWILSTCAKHPKATWRFHL